MRLPSLLVFVPVETPSLANLREHWASRSRRAALHRSTALWHMRAHQTKPSLPCVVKLTRISPRELDDDNLRPALKSVRDGVADWLNIDDRDPLVKWEYGQEKGKPKGVRVEVHAA